MRVCTFLSRHLALTHLSCHCVSSSIAVLMPAIYCTWHTFLGVVSKLGLDNYRTGAKVSVPAASLLIADVSYLNWIGVGGTSCSSTFRIQIGSVASPCSWWNTDGFSISGSLHTPGGLSCSASVPAAGNYAVVLQGQLLSGNVCNSNFTSDELQVFRCNCNERCPPLSELFFLATD